MALTLDSKVPDGPIADKWDNHKFDMKLVNPANRRKFDVHRRRHRPGRRRRRRHARRARLQREGLHLPRLAPAGALHRRPGRHQRGQELQERRRLRAPPLLRHRQGRRLPRPRGATCYRLAEVSVDIIDQCVAQGVPFAREYGGLLDNRSFGGAQVSRTFYARGQTGQQLLLGAYQALTRQVHLGTVELHNRTEMLDLVVKDGRAAGIVARDLVTGEVERLLGARRRCSPPAATATSSSCRPTPRTATSPPRGGPTARARCSPTPATRRSTRPASRPRDEFQSKLTLMSESLRNDGRIWVPEAPRRDPRPPARSPRPSATTSSSASTRRFGNLVPRDVASRNAKTVVDEGRGVGPLKNGVYLDFADAIDRLGEDTVKERYGNLFDMYERITGENPYEVPMRIYPAIHYTMGGLWVDYNLMTNVPGLFVLGEANFSRPRRQPPRCLGAHAGPGRRLLRAPATRSPTTWPDLLGTPPVPTDDPAFAAGAAAEVDDRVDAAPVGRRHPVGRPLPPRARQDRVGLLRHGPQQDRPREGALGDPGAARGVLEGRPGARRRPTAFNQSLEKAPAGRRLLRARRAHGAATPCTARSPAAATSARSTRPTEGEALRDDENFAYVGGLGVRRAGHPDRRGLHKEPLVFENVQPDPAQLQVDGRRAPT